MNTSTKKRLISLALAICLVIGAMMIPGLGNRALAAVTTSGNYFCKVGSLSGLANNAKVTLPEAPFVQGGEVYVPVSALTALEPNAAPAEAAIEEVNGVRCVNIENMGTAYGGITAEYNSMGLIAISGSGNVITGKSNDELMAVMKTFLFDSIGTDGTTQVNSFSVDDMKSLEHPYLYADQEKFDELSDLYFTRGFGEIDEVLYGYLTEVVESGYSSLEYYEKNKDTISVIPFLENGGYDEGGRLNRSSEHANRIMNMAFAYQITKDDELATAAYDYAVALGKWEHWGPGHFLNAADAMGPYAVAYDWLYSAWAELGMDVAAIELVLFTHGLVPAFYSFGGKESTTFLGTTYDVLPWRSYTAGNSPVNGWIFHDHPNNWNAVCSSGVTLAALALAGNTTSTSGKKIDTVVDGSYEPNEVFTDYPKYNTSLHDGLTTYQDYAEYIVNQATYYLPLTGMGQYVPDGSYIESNGYWSYGTNSFFKMTAALTSATGSHFGLLDTWGIDRTAYFAMNTMSSDGLGFNYHDSTSAGAQDTSLYMYLGSADGLNDATLAGMRRTFISTEISNPSIYDCLYYLDEEAIGEWSFPDLENWWEGIDGYVVRDSWDPSVGTLYAGFLGEANNVTHGQIDSGSFVYYNKGVRWFCDLGTENYNAEGFWDTNRANYYVMGAEGNNTVILTSRQSDIPYGQSLDGFGEMIEHGNNENGSFAIIDNTSVYGSYASSAKRGLLLTNDRKTTVIQDEITFNSAEDVAWIAHTLSDVDVMLSVDGTVAYLHRGGEVMRVTLIDKDGAGLKFRISDATETLLDATFTPEEAEANRGKDFTGYKKLLVEAKGVTKFNVAVVIEEVVVGETLKATGYEWKSLTNEWGNSYGGSASSGGATAEKTPVASVTLPKDAVDAGDTPVIDFGSGTGNGGSSDGETVTVAVYDFAELESLINKSIGSTVTVTLLADCDKELNISNSCIINKNGFELDAESANLVMHIDGDTVEFKSGSIEVTFVVDGASETVTFTSSANARYTEGLGTDIRYDEASDTYVSTCAVLYSDAECTKLADTTVSNINNKFYVKLENREFDGAFVTVKDGEIVGHYDGDDLFNNELINGGYDIHITSDFELTSKATIAINQAVNIYFHGHTITHYSVRNDAHLFTVGAGIESGTEVNLYGPGGFDHRATKGRVLYVEGPARVTVESVDFTSVTHVIDQRTGYVEFKNCNVLITEKASAFGVINRNNAKTGEDIPYLLINGGRIDMPKSTGKQAVFFIQSNAHLEVNGGVYITVASGSYLFRLVNNKIGTDSTAAAYDYTTTEMKAIIGEVYHNCKNGIAFGESGIADDSSTEDVDENEVDCENMVSSAIYYGVGAQFTELPSDIDKKLHSGQAARQDNAKYPYVIAESRTSIAWRNPSGGLILRENWAVGETPTKAAIPQSDGTMWVFPAGQTQAVSLPVFGLKINMSMQSDFSLNFYVEAIEGVDMSFAIKGGVLGTDYRVSDATYEIDGKMYYRIAKIGINPQNAADDVTLQVTVSGTTIEKSISPMDYAKMILSDDNQSYEAKAMMINVVKYVMSAYVYTGEDEVNTKAYVEVCELYEEYKTIATASVVDREEVTVPESITAAIAGALLNLEDSAHFRFILAEGYNGTVTLSYKALNGETVTAEYKIEDGKNNGNDYIEIPFKAYYMTDDITITVGGNSVVYKLANYYHYNATEVGELTNLLNALFAYCETAANYKASVAE